MIIAVDFDGTLCYHQYPDIGPEVPGAFYFLKEFEHFGARLMLWTMRSGGRKDGRDVLQEALDWCKERGVEFWGVNVNPEQHVWTKSNKQYAHVYIDDAAFGCPLLHPANQRPVVNWELVGPTILHRLKGLTL